MYYNYINLHVTFIFCVTQNKLLKQEIQIILEKNIPDLNYLIRHLLNSEYYF